jgi:hypothetical protein
VLPQRIQEWSLSSCVAEQTNRKALEAVRSDIERAQAALRALDRQHSDLDKLVARAKNATIVHSDDKVNILYLTFPAYKRLVSDLFVKDCLGLWAYTQLEYLCDLARLYCLFCSNYSYFSLLLVLCYSC